MSDHGATGILPGVMKRKGEAMQLVVDDRSNTAYLSLTHFTPEQIADTHILDLPAVQGGINLDFDVHGHLLGIEILNARAVLPRDALLAAGAR